LKVYTTDSANAVCHTISADVIIMGQAKILLMPSYTILRDLFWMPPLSSSFSLVYRLIVTLSCVAIMDSTIGGLFCSLQVAFYLL